MMKLARIAGTSADSRAFHRRTSHHERAAVLPNEYVLEADETPRPDIHRDDAVGGIDDLIDPIGAVRGQRAKQCATRSRVAVSVESLSMIAADRRRPRWPHARRMAVVHTGWIVEQIRRAKGGVRLVICRCAEAVIGNDRDDGVTAVGARGDSDHRANNRVDAPERREDAVLNGPVLCCS
jgi:hypothetical protein